MVTEVVVRDRGVRQVDLEFLLTHELTHVTSWPASGTVPTTSAWWLVEGIADYATMLEARSATTTALVPTRSFVANGWDGDPDVARAVFVRVRRGRGRPLRRRFPGRPPDLRRSTARTRCSISSAGSCTTRSRSTSAAPAALGDGVDHRGADMASFIRTSVR